jgi:hypothetical protein
MQDYLDGFVKKGFICLFLVSSTPSVDELFMQNYSEAVLLSSLLRILHGFIYAIEAILFLRRN